MNDSLFFSHRVLFWISKKHHGWYPPVTTEFHRLILRDHENTGRTKKNWIPRCCKFSVHFLLGFLLKGFLSTCFFLDTCISYNIMCSYLMMISWNMVLNQGSFFCKMILRTFYQPSDGNFSMSSSSKSFAILTMNMMKQDLKQKVGNVNDRNWRKFWSLIEEDIVCPCHHVSPNGFAIFTNQQIESTHVCVD